MRRLTVFLAPIAFFALLNGCVAVAIPIVAAGAIGKTSIDRARERAGLIAASSRQNKSVVTVGDVDIAGAEPAEPKAFVPPSTGDLRLSDILASPPGDERKDTLKSSVTQYDRFLSVSLERQLLWEEGQLDQSSVLVPRVSLVSPKAMACAGLPPAVIIDIDRGSSDRAAPLPFKFSAPGLPAILEQLREAEITIIWLSARPADQALTVVQELKTGNFLPDGGSDFVSLNRSPDDRKQLRRWAAAEIYCILATLGDARGDFDELYDYLLDPDFAVALERNFDNGWFLLDNDERLASGKTSKKAGAENAETTVSAGRSEFFNLKPPTTNIGEPRDKAPTPDEKEDDNGK